MTRLSATARMQAAMDHAHGEVDRSRARERNRDLQRAAEVRAAHIAAFPCQSQDEAVRTLRALAGEVFHRLVDLMGAHETACLYESLARREVQMVGGRQLARAAGDALFAANDGGEG